MVNWSLANKETLAQFNLCGTGTTAKLVAEATGLTVKRYLSSPLGGVDVKTVDPEELLKAYSIVFQDVTLFNNTVMENIRIGKNGATDEEVLRVAWQAQCDEFVSKLPNGYDTVIGENGSIWAASGREYP